MKKVKLKFKINLRNINEGIKYYLKGLYSKFDEDHIWIMSSGIAFDLLICLIPFNLILFSIFGLYLRSENTIDKIDTYLDNILLIPFEIKTNIKQTILSKIGEISSYATLTVIIGITGLLWTASGLFSTIRSVLNKIYKINIEVFFIWGRLRDIGMVFLITILFFVSFSMTSIFSIIQAIDERYLFNFLKISSIINFVPIILGLLFSFLMFYLIFKILPHGKISNKVAIISSVSSSILWEILKFIFTFYLVKLSNFTAVYGTYAAIASVILWIYYSSVTFVIGAELGQIYNEKKLLKSI
ncbi:MAG: YihY/virulence factor BrkB family protein [Ignavibacteria bacterium]